MILTVIIPIYNVEKYLKKTLNSVLNQKINGFEIILVDDGSTDESGAICDEFAEKDTRIRVFHITNGGVSRARNFGLAQATGDYIHFMDSDDLVEPEMYEQFSNIVKKEYPDIVMCGSLQINSRHHTEMVVAPEQEAFLNGRNQIAEYLNQIPLNDMKCLIHYIWNKLIEEKTGKKPKVRMVKDSTGLQKIWNPWQIRYDRLYNRTFNNSKIEAVRGRYNYKSTFDGLANSKFKDRILYLGESDKVNELYNLMDVFVLPSKHEGLGIVFIEAQINGLPVVTSDQVPREVNIGEMTKFLLLNESADKWAGEILKVKYIDRDAFYEEHRNKIDLYNKKNNVKELENCYKSMMEIR